MKEQVKQYINTNYYHLRTITKKITSNNQLAEELLHEVILQILEKKEIELDSEDNILYYIVGIIRINWFSKTSPFFYKIRKEPLNYSELMYNLEIEDDIGYIYTKEELLCAMEDSIQELDWFHKEILEHYMVLGSYRKVNELTKIPIGSIGLYINEAKKEIKDNIKLKLK